MDTNKTYSVKNRSSSMVVYKIPEAGIRREFAPGEVKKISFDELEKLSYQAGGRSLMTNFLQISNEEVTQELNIRTENEYYMSEEQVVELIKTGSYEAFLDALDYAPTGVIDLIKTYAVSIPMEDLKKRNALLEKTGFDVAKALQHVQEEKIEDESSITPVAETTTRRTTTNYKVVTKTETAE
jgi:hypothetical protein